MPTSPHGLPMTLAADRPQKTASPLAPLDALTLLLVSGKGGVGKTTFACALARRWAEQFPNDTVLLLSTDPAHSLGDVLSLPVSDRRTCSLDVPNLQIQALSAERLLVDFKRRYGDLLETLVERGSFIDGADLSPVWDLSWPGLDELMSLLEIQRILRSHEADRIVVDMAPSGHTLNLFRLMDFLEQFIGALELFQTKHQTVTTALSGRYTPDEVDSFLTEIKADLAAGRALIQDAEQTACWVVSIAESLSLAETRRFIQSLQQLQIACGGVLVNRYHGQQNILQQFRSLTPYLVVAPDLPTEPVGSQALDSWLRQISTRVRSHEDITDLITWPEKVGRGLPDFVELGRRLVIVGGKGGVGKTTVSAALALRLAKDHPDVQVRVISIDPAHSLGDALEQSLGHRPLPITSNLSAQEIDAHQVLDQFRDEYLWELAEMMSGDRGDDSLQIAYGPDAWRQIVAQALPGIDEMLSLLSLIDLLERDEQTLIVLDTAPTGHLLRFLEMPTALSDWLAWIFKLWLKHQAIAGHTDLMGRLRQLRQRVVQAQKRLKDPAYTEFISVIQHQRPILAEATRLTQQLSQMGITQNYVVHNRYRNEQALEPNLFPDQTVIALPELPHGIPPFAQTQGAAKLLI
ncbi:MAG: ArsA family ATPase [Cyanobacteria bacterium J06627_15]